MKKILSVLVFCTICFKMEAQKNDVNEIIAKVISSYNKSNNSGCLISRSINSYNNSTLSIKYYLNKDSLQQFLNNEMFKKVNLDTVFSENDFIEMSVFIDSFKEKQFFSKNQLNSKIFNVCDSCNKPFASNGSNILNLCYPLITKKRDVAIVFTENYYGYGDGRGTLYIFKKINSIWKIIAEVNIWTS